MDKAMATAVVLCLAAAAAAQVGGNSSYSESGAHGSAEQHQAQLRSVGKDDLPTGANASYVDASVLLNQPADSYVAVFGVASEGLTPAICGSKSEATIQALTAAWKALGVAPDDLATDWVAQTRLYGYEPKADMLEEKLTGFELKQNVAVKYRDPALLPKLTLAAAGAEVFDLVKVDYVVTDLAAVRDRLMAAAAEVIKAKVARYDRLLGLHLQPPSQILAERSAVYYPTQMYDSYVARESEAVREVGDRPRYTVREARKSTTYFYNGLAADGFDAVLNPVVTAPLVQFTLYLKLKCETAPAK